MDDIGFVEKTPPTAAEQSRKKAPRLNKETTMYARVRIAAAVMAMLFACMQGCGNVGDDEAGLIDGLLAGASEADQ